jgi:hypothetical protein
MTETQAARKPIIATAIYQRWNAQDIAEEQRRVDFDATRILAGLTSGQRHDLIYSFLSGVEIADSIFREAETRGLIPAHDGPFELEVGEALRAALESDPEYFSRPFPEGREFRHEDAILETPLTAFEIGFRSDENGGVVGLITITLSDMIDGSNEDFLDLLGDRLIGSSLLMEIEYHAVSVGAEHDLVMRVGGKVPADVLWDREVADYEAGLAAGAAARAVSAE